jgi:hypothetical protein
LNQSLIASGYYSSLSSPSSNNTSRSKEEEINVRSKEDGGSGVYTITYQIARHKFCERIMRPHKSNHIMIVVTLSTQSMNMNDEGGVDDNNRSSLIVVSGKWCQRCHDPECKHFNFKEYSLPQDLLSEISKSWEPPI